MDPNRARPCDHRPDRRAFLRTSAGAAAAGLLSIAPDAPAEPTADDSVDLPMVQVASTDPSLPGTWYVLDRTKPIRKLVDRTSLIPAGQRSLVFLETTHTVKVTKAKNFVLIAALPGDVGNEQTLLGCMPWVRTDKGNAIPFQVHFHQAKGAGIRVLQLMFADPPGDMPIRMGMRLIVLNPPVLTEKQRAVIRQAMLKRPGTNKKPDRQPGFPEPAFTEGGPGYVGATDGATPLQTVYNVLKATDKMIVYNGSSQFDTLDPEKAKANKKGPCIPRARVAEKALVGVARAAAVDIFHEEGSTRHTNLVVEDPDTSQYFIAEVSAVEPMMSQHPGNNYFLGALHNEGIPDPFGTGSDLTGPMMVKMSARMATSLTILQPMAITGSSNPGFKDTARCQTCLKNLPAEFRDIEKRLLKS